PPGLAGYFRSEAGPWRHSLQAAFPAEELGQFHHTLKHELTHRFVRFYYPQAPVWLNESLAKYYETIPGERGFVVLGRDPERRAFGPTRWIGRTEKNGPRVTIFADSLTPLADLNGFHARDFYAYTIKDERAQQKQRMTNYFAAWSVVHFLKNG